MSSAADPGGAVAAPFQQKAGLDNVRSIMVGMNPPRQPAAKRPSGAQLKAAIVRSVASSTAIETGQRIDRLERMLRTESSKYSGLKLAR